jgi:hypothetical protein
MRPDVDVNTPTTARTSLTSVDGSGTAAFATVLEPLPAVWPNWVRQALYPAGVPSVFRH